MASVSPTTLSPFRHSGFTALWSASLSSNLGNAIQAVAAAWLMASITESATLVALVQTAISIPVLLLALPAGAIADMFDRRAVMTFALAIMLVSSLAMVAMASTGTATPWLLLLLVLAAGSGSALSSPSVQATVGDTVPRPELAGAVSLQILGFNVARAIGPALGGALTAAAGTSAAFLANAATCLVAIGLVRTRVPVSERPSPRPRFGSAIREGVLFVTRSAPHRTIILRALTFTTAGAAVWALMPLITKELVGGGAVNFGLLLGALGFGAVLGALASTNVRRRFSSEAIIRGAGLIYGAASLLVAAKPGFWATFLLLVAGGAGWVQALSGFSVAGQLWSPRPVVGRATAVVSSVTFGGIAAGSWLWGRVADHSGIQTAVAASGALMILVPLIGFAFPMPDHPVSDAA